MEEATQQQVDKFADMSIDQLLSAYALAYKADQVATFKEYRGEILKRVRTIGEAQYTLANVKL